MVEGFCEAVPPVEPGGTLVDRVDSHEPRCCRFACDDSHSQRVGEEPRAEPCALIGPVDGKAGDQDHADGITGHAADEPRGCVVALHRAHREADIAHDPLAPHHGERACRVHFLGREGVTTQPVVEILDARGEVDDLVVGSEPLETHTVRTQARGNGSL